MARNLYGFHSYDEICFGNTGLDGINRIHVMPQQSGTSTYTYTPTLDADSSGALESRGRRVDHCDGLQYTAMQESTTAGFRALGSENYQLWFWRGEITGTTGAGTEVMQIWGTCPNPRIIATAAAPVGALAIGIMSAGTDLFDVYLMEAQPSINKWTAIGSPLATAVTLSGSVWDTVRTWCLVVNRSGGAGAWTAELIYVNDSSAWTSYGGANTVANTVASSLTPIGFIGGPVNDPGSFPTPKTSVGINTYGWWSMEQGTGWSTLDDGSTYTTGAGYGEADDSVKYWRCMTRYPNSNSATNEWVATNPCAAQGNYSCINDIKATSHPGASYLSSTVAAGAKENKFGVRSVDGGALVKAVYLSGPVEYGYSGGPLYKGPEYFKVYDTSGGGSREFAPAQGCGSGIDASNAYAFFPVNSNGGHWSRSLFNDAAFYVSIRNSSSVATYDRKIWGLVVGVLGVDITQGASESACPPSFIQSESPQYIQPAPTPIGY